MLARGRGRGRGRTTVVRERERSLVAGLEVRVRQVVVGLASVAVSGGTWIPSRARRVERRLHHGLGRAYWGPAVPRAGSRGAVLAVRVWSRGGGGGGCGVFGVWGCLRRGVVHAAVVGLLARGWVVRRDVGGGYLRFGYMKSWTRGWCRGEYRCWYWCGYRCGLGMNAGTGGAASWTQVGRDGFEWERRVGG